MGLWGQTTWARGEKQSNLVVDRWAPACISCIAKALPRCPDAAILSFRRQHAIWVFHRSPPGVLTVCSLDVLRRQCRQRALGWFAEQEPGDGCKGSNGRTDKVGSIHVYVADREPVHSPETAVGHPHHCERGVDGARVLAGDHFGDGAERCAVVDHEEADPEAADDVLGSNAEDTFGGTHNAQRNDGHVADKGAHNSSLDRFRAKLPACECEEEPQSQSDDIRYKDPGVLQDDRIGKPGGTVPALRGVGREIERAERAVLAGLQHSWQRRHKHRHGDQAAHQGSKCL